MTDPLSQLHCSPADFSGPPLPADIQQGFLLEVAHDWVIVDDKVLRKAFAFADFKEALAFTNLVGALAEAEGHHPDLLLSYGKVTVEITTHDAGGLTRSDFVIAARIESDIRAKAVNTNA